MNPKRAAATLCLAALVLLSGCWARVPSSFDPAPRRLSFADVEANDLSRRDRIVVLLFGDSGSGSSDQYEVGRRMVSTCAVRACDLALVLGDNFYENGVKPPRNGIWDDAFERKFEAPYAPLSFQFWAVAGNHDWHGGRDSVDTEVAYSMRSPRWRMPAYDYAVPLLPPWLTIYALDTTVLLADVEIGQRSRARGALCGATGWRLLAGHHPIYSSGHHGGSAGENRQAREALLPLIDECGVDVYFSGHEHHQEHLRAGGLHQVVQGAAGKLRNVGERRSGTLAEQLFAAPQFGFAIAEISVDAIELEFYGYPAGSPDAFGSIHRDTIMSRR